MLQALAHVPIIGEREDGNQEGQAGAGGMEWLKTLMAAGASKGEKAAEPFILASNLPPVPPRLVKRIQALEFTNMRDLLPDNMALAERLEALPRGLQQGGTHCQREIDSLLTWACAFLTYVAVVNEAHPDRTRGLIAYMRTLIGEARRNEGFAWKNYDAIFRRNAAAEKETDWTRLDHSLHAACLSGSQLGGGPGRSKLCSLCSGSDHTSATCALKSVNQPPTQRPLPHDTAPTHVLSRTPERKVCLSWNRGKCAFPGACSYAHVCVTCRSPAHPARDCADTPGDSTFRRLPPPSPHSSSRARP